MKEWVTVLRAADAAARWHVHQGRKGSSLRVPAPRRLDGLPHEPTAVVLARQEAR